MALWAEVYRPSEGNYQRRQKAGWLLAEDAAENSVRLGRANISGQHVGTEGKTPREEGAREYPAPPLFPFCVEHGKGKTINGLLWIGPRPCFFGSN